jgi:DNA (cytosine-5)-methyltransferase 1
MADAMKVVSLFSGIGGIDLGLERAGMQTVGFCERDPFARKVLSKNWPNVPQHDDVTTMKGDEFGQFDLLCGGPPCQRTSLAAAIHGKRTGETMWPWMLGIGERQRPEWLLIEQPPGNKAWEATVADDLARIGYHHTRFELSARGVGAPHLRRRVFFVAHAMRERCEAVARLSGSSAITTEPWPAPPRGTWRTAGSGNRGMDDGISTWVDRLRVLGNSVVPQVAEQIGRMILTAN